MTLLRTAVCLSLLSLFGCGDDSGRLDSSVRDGGTDALADSEPRDTTGDAPRIDSGTGCAMGSTLGGFCTTDVQCNDRCFCNGPERCQGGVCVQGASPCDDGIACTTDSCDEGGTRCANMADDSRCDDGNECTGFEICDNEVGCLDGIPPSCSDGDSCTVDRCSPGEGCMNTLRDVDGDGYADSRCDGGDDCDDDPMTGASVNPGTAEICDNGVDDDCDGQPDIFDGDCTPSNDTCASPLVLGASGFYGWSTQTLRDDYALSCETGTGLIDAVFEFTIAVESDLVASTNGPRYTSIELRGPGRSSCAAGSAITCANRSSSSGRSPEIQAPRLEPGTYFLIAQSPAEGLYGLSFDIRPADAPPETDSCLTAPDVGDGGLFAGDFTQHTNQHPIPACRTSTTEYPEAAYILSLDDDRDVTIRAGGQTASGSPASVAVSLVRDCSMPDSSVACERASRAELVLRPLPAGNYFITVEADSATAATYELEVDVRPPVARTLADTCGTAIDITSADATVNVADLENDGGFGCGANSLPWRDAFFEIEVAVASNVTITTDVGSVHLLNIASTCGDASTESLCIGGTPGLSEMQTLTPGIYSVGVAVPADAGAINVSASITPL